MNKEEQIREWFENKLSTIRYYIDDLKTLSIPFIYKSVCDIKSGFFNAILRSIKNKEYKKLKNCLYELLCAVIFIFLYEEKTLTDDNITSYLFHLKNTLIDKNRKYNNSYDDTVDLLGEIIIAGRLHDKIARFNYCKENNMEDDEDTLLDIAGYSVLSLIYLENKELKQ